MNFTEYLLYSIAVVLMIATPGPVMLLVASAGLKGGFSRALQTIIGTNLASLVLISLSILILKGVLEIDQHWFNAVKILGCIYIAYLGIQIVIEALGHTHQSQHSHQNQYSQQSDAAVKPSSATAGGFKQGFLVAISNPKDIIFFASFFPQFIHVIPDLNQSLTLLTITWIVLDFATLAGVYLLFNRLSQSNIYPKLLFGCGLILVAIAAYGVYSTLF